MGAYLLTSAGEGCLLQSFEDTWTQEGSEGFSRHPGLNFLCELAFPLPMILLNSHSASISRSLPQQQFSLEFQVEPGVLCLKAASSRVVSVTLQSQGNQVDGSRRWSMSGVSWPCLQPLDKSLYETPYYELRDLTESRRLNCYGPGLPASHWE